MRAASSLPLFAAAVAAQATAGPYGQCGGINYSGPSACGSGYGCTTYNPYYAQCYPGAATATPTSTPTSTSASTSAVRTTTVSEGTTARSTTKSSTFTTIVGVTSSVTSSPQATSGTATATPTTLDSGWYWIRAVASPYFHSYLQAAPSSTPIAEVAKASNAGQFKIDQGQLVWHRFGGQPPLYMQVENPVDKTQRKLKTWFAATPGTYGTFSFSGDTLQWTVSDIARPNTAAWLVCAGDQLFVNTGAFLYQTPEGCSDQTIHSYGGSTADV